MRTGTEFAKMTVTYEPIRPIYGEWKTTEAYKLLFGGYRVFYGWSEWPSYSYSTFGTDKD